MKPLTGEWIEKAEEDFLTATRAYRARKFPAYNAACFHAQQCAEKYIKARLQEADIPFRKTHDLGVLLDAVVAVEPMWETMRDSLEVLNANAVDVRYPGLTADKEMASTAVRCCSEIRRLTRASLGLKD
jgi:HEPN domain-containing protein